ncbi:hypothetical protein niasHT_021323 [Heterodera trifolii]|uniref:Uncharacterized protein n=1 Tax=Heterodera trifolii TaxID=157864 RepID=A0ABD2K6R5_9BILA
MEFDLRSITHWENKRHNFTASSAAAAVVCCREVRCVGEDQSSSPCASRGCNFPLSALFRPNSPRHPSLSQFFPFPFPLLSDQRSLPPPPRLTSLIIPPPPRPHRPSHSLFALTAAHHSTHSPVDPFRSLITTKVPFFFSHAVSSFVLPTTLCAGEFLCCLSTVCLTDLLLLISLFLSLPFPNIPPITFLRFLSSPLSLSPFCFSAVPQQFYVVMMSELSCAAFPLPC